jgi:hypothetical protein
MWYYSVNNQQVGPVEEKEIKKLVTAGTITHATMVWTTAWIPGSRSENRPGFVNGFRATSGRGCGSAHAGHGNPKIVQIRNLFTWFWISLIGIILGGIG